MYKMVHMGKIRLLNVLAEAALIVFSILLALYTNRWREEHAARQRVDRDLAAVRVELGENRAILADALPYHRQEVESFGKFLARPDLERLVKGKNMMQAVYAYHDELSWHGIWHPNVTPGNLSDTAWKTALANGDLPFMDPDLVKSLTDYYTFQGTLMNTIKLVGQIYMSPPPYDRAQTVTMLYTMQGTYRQLADQEGSLLEEVDETLKVMPRS